MSTTKSVWPQMEGLAPVRPEDRVTVYGNLVAPLTNVLQPLQNSGGRSDPLAMLGQRFSDKSNVKQLRKAQEDMQKGKTKKYNVLEGGLQWVSFLIKHLDNPNAWNRRTNN